MEMMFQQKSIPVIGELADTHNWCNNVFNTVAKYIVKYMNNIFVVAKTTLVQVVFRPSISSL